MSKTPTTMKQILKILVNSKSKSEVVTVEDNVEAELPEVGVFVLLELLELLELLLLKFISTEEAAKECEKLNINKKTIPKTIINFDNFDIGIPPTKT